MASCEDILSRNADAWKRAVAHPFLTAVQARRRGLPQGREPTPGRASKHTLTPCFPCPGAPCPRLQDGTISDNQFDAWLVQVGARPSAGARAACLSARGRLRSRHVPRPPTHYAPPTHPPLQDGLFVLEFIRFHARALASAPPAHFPLLLGAAAALKDELAWFQVRAGLRARAAPCTDLHSSSCRVRAIPACALHCIPGSVGCAPATHASRTAC